MNVSASGVVGDPLGRCVAGSVQVGSVRVVSVPRRQASRAVCWPRARCRDAGAEAGNRPGGWGWPAGARPTAPCSSVSLTARDARPKLSARANASVTLFTNPAGTSPPSRSRFQCSAAGGRRAPLRVRARSATRWPTRGALLTKRASAASSGRPTPRRARRTAGRCRRRSRGRGPAGEDLVRRDARVRVAGGAGGRAGGERAGRLVGERGEQGAEQVHVDWSPRPVASLVRSASRMPENAFSPVSTSTSATPDLRRRAVRLAGDAHQAADRLHQQVVARQGGARAVGRSR